MKRKPRGNLGWLIAPLRRRGPPLVCCCRRILATRTPKPSGANRRARKQHEPLAGDPRASSWDTSNAAERSGTERSGTERNGAERNGAERNEAADNSNRNRNGSQVKSEAMGRRYASSAAHCARGSRAASAPPARSNAVSVPRVQPELPEGRQSLWRQPTLGSGSNAGATACITRASRRPRPNAAVRRADGRRTGGASLVGPACTPARTCPR